MNCCRFHKAFGRILGLAVSLDDCKFVACIAIISLVAHAAAADSNNYSQSMFRRAMTKDNLAVSGFVSVSPLYVLITLRDPNTGAEREVCTLSTNLQGAIEREYHLDLLKDGRKIFDIAMSARNRVFPFKNRATRQLVAPLYTAEQLAEVRRLLRGKTREQLRSEADADLSKAVNEQSSLTKIYRRVNGKQVWDCIPLRIAVAHVLLEHSVLVGEAHDSGVLYVDTGVDNLRRVLRRVQRQSGDH